MDDSDLTPRDLEILGGIDFYTWLDYSVIFESPVEANPLELRSLFERGYLDLRYNRERNFAPEWKITDKAIERLEVAGGC
jgi:hypothetical protein